MDSCQSNRSICHICQGEKFELYCGQQFCNECGAQSQEICEYEQDGDDITQSSKYLRAVQSNKCDRSDGELQDESALWPSCEAYNIILNHQVEALITNGASPALKNVVMELWFKYLKACEVEFVPDKDYWTPQLSSLSMCRDMSLLEGKSPNASKSVKKRKRKKYEVPDGKHIYVDDNTCRKSKQKKKETKKRKKSSDQEIPNDESEIPQSNSFQKKKKVKRVVGTKVPRTKEFAGIECMNLSKTISFCYAGLLFLQEQILLSDIIRWIRKYHIPFLNAYRVLPESMISQHPDISALKTSRIPRRRKIVRESSRLLCFLDKREIPPQPVCHIALRYIMDLHIPDEMASVIHQLVNVQCPTLSSKFNAPVVITVKKHIPYYELEAAALVIVALKIVFGLDGQKERELSTLASVRNIYLQAGIDRQMFVWDDWQDHMSVILNRQRNLNVTSTNYSAKESLDVTSLHDFWKQIKTAPADVKKMEITNEKVLKKLEKRRASQVFSSLPNMNQKWFGYRPNSFPICSLTTDYISQIYEVDYFMRDFSTCILPRASRKSSHWYTKLPDQSLNILNAMELLGKLPQSICVLVEAMCYTTNSLASDLLSEVQKIEKLLSDSQKKNK